MYSFFYSQQQQKKKSNQKHVQNKKKFCAFSQWIEFSFFFRYNFIWFFCYFWRCPGNKMKIKIFYLCIFCYIFYDVFCVWTWNNNFPYFPPCSFCATENSPLFLYINFYKSFDKSKFNVLLLCCRYNIFYVFFYAFLYYIYLFDLSLVVGWWICI